MRKLKLSVPTILAYVLASSVAHFIAYGADELPSSTAAQTPAARIKTDLSFLASDELAGRGVGSEGIARAGEFLAARFADLGFQVDAFDGTPYQNFKIPGPKKLGSDDRNRLVFRGGKLSEEWKLDLGAEFNPLSLGSNGAYSGEVIFAGYGITASEYQYDDYAGFDPRGKVIIAIRKEPQQQSDASVFAGTQNSQYAFFTSKERNAASHGAAALILINDSVTVAAASEALKKQLQEARTALSNLQATPLPSDESSAATIRGKIRGAQDQVNALQIKMDKGDFDTLLGVSEGGNPVSGDTVPTIFAKRSVIDQLLALSYGKTLSEIENEIDRTGRPLSLELGGIVASGETEIVRSETPMRNVIGVLPGSGPLAEEYVVVGAHYDHVGMGGMGSLAPGTIAVHNGADDNGSGTVTMLEIARQMAAMRSTNQRTLLFMAFTGEESGLLGSVHYVRNPRWALEKTVAMVNLDMVGRLNNNELTVYGTGTAKEFPAQIDRLGNTYQFRLVKVPQGRGASDHASFYDAKIPVFHFFTGLHNEYHRPTDDVELINIEGMVRISQLVTELVKEIATSPMRPELQLIEGSARPRSQTPSGPTRALLGVRFSSEENSPAVLVGVTEGGPAFKAGIRAGDAIVSLADKPVNTTSELRSVLAGLRTGMKVPVVIQRGSESIKLQLDFPE